MPWISRLLGLLHRDRLAREQQEELEFHLAMREELNLKLGMTRAEAHRSARVRFGSLAAWRERMSEIDLGLLPQTVLQDLRYGARMLLRNPGFTVAAVLALGIGIGVNSAAFTAYKAFFKRSLDARDAGQMANLALSVPSGLSDGSGNTFTNFSYPDYEAYRDHLHSFSGLIAVSQPQYLALTGADGIARERNSGGGSLMQRWGMMPKTGEIETAVTFMVSDNYFAVMGASAQRGRLLSQEDFAGRVASLPVLISENYWQQRFARDPAILGKALRLNGVPFTVVGITPHNFVGTSVIVPDFWLPLSAEPLVHPTANWLPDRESLSLRVFGRVAAGVSLDQAQAEMTVLAGHLRALHDPHSDLAKPATALVWPGSPFPLPLSQFRGLRYTITLIMAAVWMVLAVACANVASLQLARAAARHDELSMRLSLGARRLRIIRQLLTESALLGLLAGAVALLVTWALLRIAVAIAQQELPADFGALVFNVNPDLGIFAYAFGLSLVAGVLFGLAPALESSRAALSSALKASPVAGRLRGRRMRDSLIAAQVAISMMLMVAGSMLIHSALRALKMDTGYNSRQTIDLTVKFPEAAEYTAARKAALLRDLRTRLAALPGVAAVTTAIAPDGDGIRTAAVALDGRPPSPANTRAILYYTYIQPNYFETLEIPLLFGRAFEAQPGQPEPSAILSESAARILFPGQSPIGRSLRLGTDGQYHNKGELLPDGPAYQVTGIVRDRRGVLMGGGDSEQIYIPLPETRIAEYPILVRASGDPAALTGTLGTVIDAVDPNLEVTTATLEQMLRETASFVASATAAVIASAVGLLGLLLAAMGIYGTVSYVVVLRTREVGIRMALGASKGSILALMLRSTASPVIVGLALGACLAVGASALLHGVLYGLHMVDPISFLGVSGLFLAIALVATYLPSRRAMRVDPMVALRYE